MLVETHEAVLELISVMGTEQQVSILPHPHLHRGRLEAVRKPCSRTKSEA